MAGRRGAIAAPSGTRGNPVCPTRRERLADVVGNRPEILRDDLGARLAEDREHAFAERDLIGLVLRREESFAAVARPAEGPIEADEMIDAVAVVEVGRPPRAIAQPAEVVGGDDVPSINRHPPILAGGAEGVGRHAERDVEPELMLAGPDVGAESPSTMNGKSPKMATPLAAAVRRASCHCDAASHCRY